jgi:hypothetical protein
MLRTILCIGALLTAAPAMAQNVCVKRDDVRQHLASKFSETPVAMGIASNGGVVEVYSSGAGESWTIVITMPNGMSCMIASGENWEAVPVSLASPI